MFAFSFTYFLEGILFDIYIYFVIAVYFIWLGVHWSFCLNCFVYVASTVLYLFIFLISVYLRLVFIVSIVLPILILLFWIFCSRFFVYFVSTFLYTVLQLFKHCVPYLVPTDFCIFAQMFFLLVCIF